MTHATWQLCLLADSSLEEVADSTVPIDDLEYRGADGESFEKKRRVSSPYQ